MGRSTCSECTRSARLETMTQPAWRVRVRRVDAGGASCLLSTSQGRGSAARAAFRFWAEAWNRRDATDINVELEEREAGASRFRPIVQAVGNQVIWWVSKQDASAYGHERSGWAESYQGSAAT